MINNISIICFVCNLPLQTKFTAATDTKLARQTKEVNERFIVCGIWHGVRDITRKARIVFFLLSVTFAGCYTEDDVSYINKLFPCCYRVPNPPASKVNIFSSKIKTRPLNTWLVKYILIGQTSKTKKRRILRQPDFTLLLQLNQWQRQKCFCHIFLLFCF